MTQPLAYERRPAVVLLVEDNMDHAYLTRASFEEAHLKVNLQHVTNGEEALKFLRREPPYQDAPWPDLVLLDIHMPRVDGYDVMAQLQADEKLRSLVVVVLTTSADELDVQRMYALGCRSFLTKPVDFAAFTQTIAKLSSYWFELVVLPKPAGS
jgi:CheY-like chemotaxis protein